MLSKIVSVQTSAHSFFVLGGCIFLDTIVEILSLYVYL